MDKVVKTKARSFMFLMTGLIVGFIMGTVSLSTLISYRIENYHKRIKHLESCVYDRDIRLTKLEESINKNRYLLKDIQVFFTEDSEFDEITIEKYVKGKYKKLIGRDIKEFDAEVVTDVVDNRMIKVDNKQYLLKVSKLVISEVMKVWVEVDTV